LLKFKKKYFPLITDVTVAFINFSRIPP